MIVGCTYIGPDMQSAVGAGYVIFLTDCAAYRNSFVSAVRVTHTKTCWRNKMIVTSWIFQRVRSFGGLARWLGTPAQLNDSNQCRGSAIVTGKGPTYQRGTGTSAETVSSVSCLCVGPKISDRQIHYCCYWKLMNTTAVTPWSCSVRRTGTVKWFDCSVGKEGARSLTYY